VPVLLLVAVVVVVGSLLREGQVAAFLAYSAPPMRGAYLWTMLDMYFREHPFQRLSGNSYARANLLTISRVIAT
jgi:hypothetical protein